MIAHSFQVTILWLKSTWFRKASHTYGWGFGSDWIMSAGYFITNQNIEEPWENLPVFCLPCQDCFSSAVLRCLRAGQLSAENCKVWAEINLSSLKFWLVDILSQQWKNNYTSAFDITVILFLTFASFK